LKVRGEKRINMALEDLGYHEKLESYRQNNGLGGFAIGRVIAEHKERYIVNDGQQEFEAEITGNMRFTAQERSDYPAVGDWVAFSVFDDTKGLIHGILPRHSLLERKAVGKQGDKQIIAANIDDALIVQAVDRDFNINRLERYLTLCHTSRVNPVIVLNKIDLITSQELQEKLSRIGERVKDVPILAISNQTGEGLHQLKTRIEKGKTYCLLGSSGVGKSTLLNTLSGQEVMQTNAISESSDRGRHVTTHRELHLLECGGILIDNPGMREVGMADFEEGIASTFDHIVELSKSCRYKNCTHTNEPGCAVRNALDTGELDDGSYENYLKMEKEKGHYEMTLVDKRKRDRAFGKMMKDFKKNYSRPKD